MIGLQYLHPCGPRFSPILLLPVDQPHPAIHFFDAQPSHPGRVIRVLGNLSCQRGRYEILIPGPICKHATRNMLLFLPHMRSCYRDKPLQFYPLSMCSGFFNSINISMAC
ncbi:uncharacterized protein N7479_001574 [Penicillium vulpinum]|uniref:uncharacterized protein n=1 Tax=Penicillium vulpinum TaxID=29845 RepID=UPI002548AFE6|nr:uncharacterized protein N7479_001574 [Penicillium vulpinum]KAJ5971656.1 hypothetical protein N7479_001574 [Penicillium vulpinum]